LFHISVPIFENHPSCICLQRLISNIEVKNRKKGSLAKQVNYHLQGKQISNLIDKGYAIILRLVQNLGNIHMICDYFQHEYLSFYTNVEVTTNFEVEENNKQRKKEIIRIGNLL